VFLNSSEDMVVEFGNPRHRLNVLSVDLAEVLQFFDLLSGQREIHLHGFQALAHCHSFVDDI
jgi:hypothetical protein